MNNYLRNEKETPEEMAQRLQKQFAALIEGRFQIMQVGNDHQFCFSERRRSKQT